EIGLSPLLWAIRRHQPELLLKLLQKGAQVNPEADADSKPLRAAAVEGQLEMVHLLLARGARLDFKDAANTFLSAAVYGKNSQILGLFLARGLDPNSQDRYGNTPLQFAIGSAEMVRMLVEKGADVNTRNRAGFTPLANACLEKNLETARYLLERS